VPKLTIEKINTVLHSASKTLKRPQHAVAGAVSLRIKHL
jgi:hypothetical protein